MLEKVDNIVEKFDNVDSKILILQLFVIYLYFKKILVIYRHEKAFQNSLKILIYTPSLFTTF